MDRLSLFPITATIEDDTLTLAGHSLAALADEFGTPLYVYDRATLDAAAAACPTITTGRGGPRWCGWKRGAPGAQIAPDVGVKRGERSSGRRTHVCLSKK